MRLIVTMAITCEPDTPLEVVDAAVEQRAWDMVAFEMADAVERKLAHPQLRASALSQAAARSARRRT